MASMRPKRKCAQVSYYEPDPDPDNSPVEDKVVDSEASSQAVAAQNDDEVDESDDDDYSPNKKSKSKAKRKKKKIKAKPKMKKETFFPFLDLPPELRNEIYKHALVEPDDLSVIAVPSAHVVRRGTMERRERNNWYAGWHGGNQHYWAPATMLKDDEHNQLSPALLALNRQINAEANHYLYNQEIQFAHPPAMHYFLSQIGPTNRLLLNKLVLRGWCEPTEPWRNARFAAYALLTTAINLGSLVLDRGVYFPSNVSLGMYGSYFARDGDDLFRDISVWLRAMDAAKGKGAGRRALTFTKSNFGNPEDIKDQSQKIDQREKLFMEAFERWA